MAMIRTVPVKSREKSSSSVGSRGSTCDACSTSGESCSFSGTFLALHEFSRWHYSKDITPEFVNCQESLTSCLTFRLTWVVGQAGLLEGLAVITLANIVTVITAISMSAVSTNGQIKGGGIYYMISRSLGMALGLLFLCSQTKQTNIDLYARGGTNSPGYVIWGCSCMVTSSLLSNVMVIY